MPEMLQYCGKQFTVYKRADKACDTVGKTGSRRMRNCSPSRGPAMRRNVARWLPGQLSPLLEGGLAQASRPCYYRLDARGHASGRGQAGDEKAAGRSLSVAVPRASLSAATVKKAEQSDPSQDVYVCQATELPKATSYLAWWDIRQYVRTVTSGNVGLDALARAALISGSTSQSGRRATAVFALGSRLRRLPAMTLVTVGPSQVSASRGSSQISVSPSAPASRGFVQHVNALLDKTLVEYPNVRGQRRKTPSVVLDLRRENTFR